MRTSRGVAAAALVVAMVAGTSGAAMASQDNGVPSPGGSPPPASQKADIAQKLRAGQKVNPLDQLAKRYGVTVDQLENALRNVKIALGQQGGSPTDPAIVAQFAQNLGLSQTQAEQLLNEVFGQATAKSGGRTAVAPTVEAFIRGLAQQLGISREQASRVYKELEKLDQQQGGVDPNSPQFAAIARGAGVTAGQLADAIRQVKVSLAGSGQGRSPKPVKSPVESAPASWPSPSA